MASRITHLLVASGILLTTFGAPLDAQNPIIVVDEKAAVCSKFDKSYGLPVEVKPYIVWTLQLVPFALLNLSFRTTSGCTTTFPLVLGQIHPSCSTQSSIYSGLIYGWFHNTAPSIAAVITISNTMPPNRQRTNQMAQRCIYSSQSGQMCTATSLLTQLL